jgi:RNA polymerase sigma factor (sigma-70 family)
MSSEAAVLLADCQPIDLGAKWQTSYPVLIRRARNLVRGGSQDPEDLISEATVKVLNYLNLQREAENFVGLMLVSLLQVYLDGKRRQGNRIFAAAGAFIETEGYGGFGADTPSVERSYIAKETLGDIFDYLATLPPDSQQLFQLRFVGDLSYDRIAQEMGITEVCARQKVKKLRQKLLAWIEDKPLPSVTRRAPPRHCL